MIPYDYRLRVTILEYISDNERSPFGAWFNSLSAYNAAKIARVLYRMEQGNFSNTKGVGEGVYENKINIGPGYRIYFGQDGEDIIILLGGGTKKQQSKDIAKAKACWKDYQRRKK